VCVCVCVSKLAKYWTMALHH